MRQFLHQPPANIRVVQLGPEEVRMHPSSFQEGLFETPRRCSLTTISSQPVSLATTVHFAKALAQTYNDWVIPETIHVLETHPVNPTPSRAAHHEEMKQQKRPEGQEDKPPTHPIQAKVQGNPNIPTDLLGRALSEQRPAYRSRRPDLHVTKEALVLTVSLNNPIWMILKIWAILFFI